MTKLCRMALVFGVAALIASPALAQRERPRGGGGFGGGPVFLLTQESVQKELKLSEDQVKKVKELQEKQREAFQGVTRENFREKMEEVNKSNEKAIKEILKADQHKRLNQIVLQREGARALSRKDVAEALKISDEQKDKIKTIQEESRKEMGELRNTEDRQERAKKFEEIRKNTEEKVMGVLTAEQKTKLKEMQGEPFKGEIKSPQFGGGRGGRGGRQDRR